MMRIPAVTSLIGECWDEAEKSVRALLKMRYRDRDEEFITGLLHGEFRVAVEETNKTSRVYEAFKCDIGNAFPDLQYSQMENIASGIGATTTLHPRELEKKLEAILELY
jgi:hypothetical protein